MEESRMQLGLSVCLVTALSTLVGGNHGAFPSADAERNGLQFNLQSARDVSNTKSDILQFLPHNLHAFPMTKIRL